LNQPSSHAKKRWVVGLGAFLVLAAIGAFLFSIFMLSNELERLDRLTPFESARASELRVGQPILITSIISDKNPPLIRDLVVACEETQDEESGSWQPQKQFHRPLVVTRDGIEFVVTLRQPCPRGHTTEIPNPESNLWRWVGLRSGDTLTVVGTVTGADPLTLWGEDAFAGSVDDYRRYLTQVGWYVVPFSGLLLLAGVGLILLGRRGRRQGTTAIDRPATKCEESRP
jgi:hypothetical protein